MKRMNVIFVAVMLATVTILTGCSKNNTEHSNIILNASYPKDLNISHNSSYQIIKLHPDWPSYRSVDEIVSASTNIYSGYVSDISFDIIDYSTGMSDKDPNSESRNRSIYTIYTVSLTNNYKGESPSEIKICKIGGVYGYKENEQYDLLRSSKIIPDSFVGISVCDDDCTLSIGNEYLFCISRLIGGYDQIINPYQFAHHIDSENAKSIVDFLN